MSPSIAFSGPSALDLLRGSTSNGVLGVPLNFLGRSRVRADLRRKSLRGVNVVAKIVKKGKVKHEYPWPDEIGPDPNVKGGILSYLSEFKPLKEKPKPVTLPFEKPLMGLEKKIMDVS